MFSDPKKYYIQPSAVSFQQASAGAQYIIASASSNAAIMLSGQIKTANQDSNYVNAGGIIGYNDSLSYRTWRITGANIKLQDSEAQSSLYIYLRLASAPANQNGQIFLSSKNYDIDGWQLPDSATSTEMASTEQKASSTQKDGGAYFFVCIGSISAPDTNSQRTVTYSTGRLDTAEQKETDSSQALDQMFKLDSTQTYIIPQLPFEQLKFKNSPSNLVNKVVTSLAEWTSSVKSTTLATLSAVEAHLTDVLNTFSETLNLKFFRKDQSDTTPYTAVFGDAQIKKDLTKSDSTKSTGNLSVDGKITGAEAQISGAITGASATISGKTKTTTLESTNGSELLGTTKFSASVEDGKSGGAITHPKNDNDTKLQVEYLHVLKKATFESIEVNHVEHIAGNLIMSPAKATLYDVVNMNDCYRCYFLASDGDGNTINNTWKVNDQAYCCTFDATALADTNENGTHTDTKVGNRYYWRLVKAVSSQTVTRNGKTCHYIDLWNVSDTTKVDTSSDTPWIGDYVVVRGNRTDTSRQGTIELNTTGAESNLPSIRIYNGINSFTMPTSKIDMNPHNVKMLVNELKIETTNNTVKDLKTYINENTDQFHIFETESTAMPTLSNEPYTTWTDEEKVMYSTEPNNAVILNSDGRTWKFCKNTSGEYYFEEFTDPWLLAQHQKVSDILDDKCITADEIPEIKKLYAEAMALEVQLNDDYSYFTSPSQRLYEAKEAVLDAMVSYVEDFLSHREDTTPIYFSDYTGTKEAGHTTLDITRDNAIGAATDYAIAVAEWNSALASEKQSKVGETAVAEAKEYIDKYITDNIDQIVGNGLDNHIKDVVIPAWYETGTPSVKGRIESNESELTTVKESYEKTKAVVNGMVATTNSMFAGTSQTNFIQDSVDVNGTKVLLYQIKKQATNSDGQRLYWKTDADGNRYQTTEVTTEAVAVGDYSKEPVKATDSAYIANPANYLPRMVVANTDQSGLVTKSGFAAVFAQEVDADGNLSAIAQMGVYVKHVGVNTLPWDVTSVGTSGKRWYSSSTDKYYYLSETDEDKTKGTYYYVESTAGISADKVSITSGNRNSSLGNYWSIDENGNAILGNVYAKDVTVSGVLLNLITELEAGDDRFIEHVYQEGTDLTYTRDDLDVLRCGDIVRIKSTNGNRQSICLPYYINADFQHRTYTKFGGNKHLITAEELRQLIGKRLTIIVEDDSGISNYHAITGLLELSTFYDDGSSGLAKRVEGLERGTTIYEMPVIGGTYGRGLTVPGTYNLLFKACYFRDSEGRNRVGYAWFFLNDTNLPSTIDSAWADEEDDE